MSSQVRVRHDQAMKPPLADHVVDALIAAHLVDPVARQPSVDVVARVLESPAGATGEPGGPAGVAATTPVRRSLPQLVEVVAYLGGALVLAAGGLFLIQQWDALGFGARVALLAVVSVVLGVAGVVSSRVPAGAASLRDESQDARRRLAGVLLTGAALAVAILVGYVTDELMDTSYPEIYWPAVAGAGAGALVAAIGYRIAPTAVGVVAMLSGVMTMAGNLVSGIDVGSEGDTVGVVFVGVGVVWLVLTELGVFREVTIARTLGVAVTLFGAQSPAIDGTHAWLGYALTVLVAVVGIAIYLGKVAWPYLAAAVVAVTLVVPEAVSDWTEGSLGAVGGVLVAGVTLLVASFAGYRLREGARD